MLSSSSLPICATTHIRLFRYHTKVNQFQFLPSDWRKRPHTKLFSFLLNVFFVRDREQSSRWKKIINLVTRTNWQFKKRFFRDFLRSRKALLVALVLSTMSSSAMSSSTMSSSTMSSSASPLKLEIHVS